MLRPETSMHRARHWQPARVNHAGLILLWAAFVMEGTAGAQVAWPSDILRVERALHAVDVGERREASERLFELPPGVGRELVKVALKDSDAEVRLSAARAASGSAMPGTGALVLSWLSDPSGEARLAALGVLRVDPVAGTAPTLARALSDAAPEVRVAAAEALAALGSPDAARSLLGHLEDQDKKVRLTVYRALGHLEDRTSALSLMGKASDPDADVRAEVLNALGRLKEPRSLNTLLMALKDRDESVRDAALWALGQLGDQQAVPAIGSLLESEPRAAEQRAALFALAAIGGDTAIDVNMKVLTSTHPMAATDFAKASLVRFGSAAVPALSECVGARHEQELADRCLSVWSTVEPRSAALAANEALQSGAVSELAAVRAMGLGGQASLLPGVLTGLLAEDPSLRATSREAASRLLRSNPGQTMAVDPIAEALVRYRTDLSVLAEHLSLLGSTGALRAGAQVLPYCRAGNPVSVRLAAIAALGDLPPAAYDRVLLDLIHDADPRVAGEAGLALRKMGRAEILPFIFSELEQASATQAEALEVSLLGPLSRNHNVALSERAFEAMLKAEGREKDLWLEALGRSPVLPWLPRLQEKLATFGSADRRKVAEAFAGAKAAVPILERLAADSDASVRAAAVWSLGSLDYPEALPWLKALTRDRDVMVAINATAALARFSLNKSGSERQALCALLVHAHPYVRINALVGLRTHGPEADACSAQIARLFSEDPSEQVRSVAGAVINGGAVQGAPAGPLTVLVVPVGRAQPEPESAFALMLPQGLIRAGLADRRGGVFEAEAQAGEAKLLVPAHLAW